MKTRNITLPVIHYLNDLFRPSDKKTKETLQKEKIEEEIKDIERMLYDFYPPERVQIFVTELRNRYNATADYTGFLSELENNRSTLVSRYLSYANPFK